MAVHSWRIVLRIKCLACGRSSTYVSSYCFCCFCYHHQLQRWDTSIIPEPTGWQAQTTYECAGSSTPLFPGHLKAWALWKGDSPPVSVTWSLGSDEHLRSPLTARPVTEVCFLLYGEPHQGETPGSVCRVELLRHLPICTLGAALTGDKLMCCSFPGKASSPQQT